MHRETKAELINNVTSVLGAGMKEWFVHKKEKEMLEEKKKHRVELAEAKANASRRNGGGRGQRQRQTALERASDVADEYHEILTEARETEDCGLCAELIEKIEDEPLSVQHQALPELRVLKRRADRGASQSELRQFIEDSEVLFDVIQDQTREKVREQVESQGLKTESRRNPRDADDDGDDDTETVGKQSSLIADDTREQMMG